MTNYRAASVLGLMGALGLLTVGTPAHSQAVAFHQQPGLQQPSPTNNQDGMEILARGPMHEAFASPVDSQPQAGRVAPRQPPAAIEEMPPDQRPTGENVQWIPGYWSFDDDRNDFIWVSGVWRQPPPDRQWVPGDWRTVADGSQWTSGFWAPVNQEQVQYLPQPPAPVEAAPSVPAPSPASVMVPGTWYYHQTRYVWRPAYWVDPRPGWVWIPACYRWTPVGYVFVDGYWDYELRTRGMMFAPVAFPTVAYARPAFVYRPTYVVQTDFVLGALFVRTTCSSYYYGDYFTSAYARVGYTPFTDYRYSVVGYDPLFNYYRGQYGAHNGHGHGAGWEQDLRGLYRGRYDGTYSRPPRTLTQQNTFAQNYSTNRPNRVDGFDPNNMQVLASLNQLAQRNSNLESISRNQVIEQQRAAQSYRQAATKRATLEAQLAATNTRPNSYAAATKPVSAVLPAARTVLQKPPRVQPPPVPTNAAVARPAANNSGTPTLLTKPPAVNVKPQPATNPPQPVAKPQATAPVVRPPANQPPANKPHVLPPANKPPVTQPPANKPQVVNKPPATQPPANQPPANKPPATKPPETKPPMPSPGPLPLSRAPEIKAPVVRQPERPASQLKPEARTLPPQRPEPRTLPPQTAPKQETKPKDPNENVRFVQNPARTRELNKNDNEKQASPKQEGKRPAKQPKNDESKQDRKPARS